MNTIEQNALFRGRRKFLGTIASVALGMGAAASGGAARAAAQRGGSKILVAYFTRTGNTRVIAGKVRLALGADVFAIEPAAPSDLNNVQIADLMSEFLKKKELD